MIELKRRMVDLGYPDPGHYEWFLIKSTTRKFKILQYFFGNKEKTILCYGEDKPTNDKVATDIKKY